MVPNRKLPDWECWLNLSGLSVRSFLFGAGVELTKPPSTRSLFAKSAPDRRCVAGWTVGHIFLRKSGTTACS